MNVSTPRCTLEQGLRAWFKERTRSMRHLKFEAGVLDPATANAYVNETELYGLTGQLKLRAKAA